LRPGIVDAVLVVLRRDRRQGVGLVAVALEIALGDAAEDAGEARGNVAFFLSVARRQQDVADLRAGGGRHLLRPHHQREAAAPGGQEVARAVHRGRAGGAGVLEARRRHVTQFGQRLQHQGRREILLGEAVVEQADEDAVDFGGRDAGVLDRRPRHPGDQALDVRFLKLAEGRMRPADDAGFRHRTRSYVSSDTVPSGNSTSKAFSVIDTRP
jgi:hypothetical protein